MLTPGRRARPPRVPFVLARLPLAAFLLPPPAPFFSIFCPHFYIFFFPLLFSLFKFLFCCVLIDVFLFFFLFFSFYFFSLDPFFSSLSNLFPLSIIFSSLSPAVFPSPPLYFSLLHFMSLSFALFSSLTLYISLSLSHALFLAPFPRSHSISRFPLSFHTHSTLISPSLPGFSLLSRFTPSSCRKLRLPERLKILQTR